jgi:hypothetical protein
LGLIYSAALQFGQKVVPPSLSRTLPVKTWCRPASRAMRRAWVSVAGVFGGEADDHERLCFANGGQWIAGRPHCR